jgi:hypothetical protein
MSISTRSLALGGLGISTVALALVLGGIALSAPGDGGKIDGCYDESNGLLSVLTDKKTTCDADTETAISWNVQGPKGDPGPLPPAPAAFPLEGQKFVRLTRAQRSRARLPLAPLKRAAIRRGRRGTLPVARAVPLPVGDGGLRVLTAQVPEWDIEGGPIRLLGGTGPDTARSARVVQAFNDNFGWFNGRGIVEVEFKTPVRGCTAVVSGTDSRTAEDTTVFAVGQGLWVREDPRPDRVKAHMVEVAMTSNLSNTAPFNLIVVCDPRNDPPRTVGVAQPVPPRPTVVVP